MVSAPGAWWTPFGDSSSVGDHIGNLFSGDTWDAVNPWSHIAKGITGAVTGVIQAFLMTIWNAGLGLVWVMLRIVSAFTTPDLSGDGPLQGIMPVTLGISVSLAGVLMFVQLTIALWRRDGHGLAQLLMGMGQYLFVYAGMMGVCAGMLVAATELEHAILNATLHVDALSGLDPKTMFLNPKGQGTVEAMFRDGTDTVATLAFALTSFFMIIPAAFFGILVALTRAGGLLILIATMPISAAGFLSPSTRGLFWKTFHWFVAAVLISPSMALVLGISVKVSEGVALGQGDSIWGSIGTAIVGGALMLFAVFCPVALFRLFSWMDPGTPAGSQMRQSWQDAKDRGFLTGGRPSRGGDQAGKTADDGRAAGEQDAESSTQGRFAQAMPGGAPSASGASGSSGAQGGGLPGLKDLAGGLSSLKGRAMGGLKGMAKDPVGTFMAGQHAAASIAATARNLQADVLGGSGVGAPFDFGIGRPVPDPAGRDGGSGGSGGSSGGSGGTAPHLPRPHDQEGADIGSGSLGDQGQDLGKTVNLMPATDAVSGSGAASAIEAAGPLL